MVKRLLLALTALAVLAYLILVVYGRSTDREWEEHLAGLRAAGEPLSFEEIQARRLPVGTTGETVASVVTRVAAAVEAAPGPISRGVLGMRDGPKIDFFTGIPPDAIETTRRYLAARRPALAEIATIRSLEPGRFDISYDGSPINVATRFAGATRPINLVTRLLYLDTALKLIDGDTEAAASVIPLQLKMVLPVVDEPAEMAHLTRMSAAATAVRVLENVLRVGTLREETLRRLDGELADYIDSLSMKWALWGERVMLIGLFDEMRRVTGVPGTILGFATRAEAKRFTEMLGWLIEADDDPAELLEAARSIESALSKLPESQVLTKARMTTFAMLPILHVHFIASVQAARVAIAAERYGMNKGRLPADLVELMPEFLDEIHIDPFDGKSMKFATNDRGIVVYSTGEDGIDDGGSIRPRTGERRARDIGFRLFDTERRGLVLLEEPPASDQ